MKGFFELISRLFFELIRIILLFFFVGGGLSYLLKQVYILASTDVERFGWIGSVAIILLFIVLYRNKLQFSGWYNGKAGKRLPKIVTQALVYGATLLLLLPPILSYTMN